MNGVPRLRRSIVFGSVSQPFRAGLTFGAGPTGLFPLWDLFSRSHIASFSPRSHLPSTFLPRSGAESKDLVFCGSFDQNVRLTLMGLASWAKYSRPSGTQFTLQAAKILGVN